LFGQLLAGEQESAPAGEAADADVGAEADDLPFVAATGVGLAQAQDIA